MSAAVLGVMTGVPPMRFTQEEITERFLARLGGERRRERAIRLIFERAGVKSRYSVVDHRFYAEDHTTQTRNDRYMQEAVPLGEETIRRGLDAAGVSPQEIDDLIVVSCTGISVPGLDLHLAARLGMRHDLRRTGVLGMGCYGAFPGMLRARDAVTSNPERLALVLALELCSLHLQLNDTAENVVSSALFSDGASMALIGGDTRRKANIASPRIIDAQTYCDYTTLEHMTFSLTDHGFRMYLSSYVPDLLATQIEGFIDTLLRRNDLKRDSVRFWGIHPGSAKIVDYVQQRLGLADAQVEHSHAVLGEYGNMSSATILFVLDRIQTCGQPSPGDYGVLMAFGPGLTMEGMLVRW